MAESPATTKDRTRLMTTPKYLSHHNPVRIRIRYRDITQVIIHWETYHQSQTQTQNRQQVVRIKIKYPDIIQRITP